MKEKLVEKVNFYFQHSEDTTFELQLEVFYDILKFQLALKPNEAYII
jgi:hypothetical protein